MTLTALLNRPLTIVRRSPGDTTDEFGNRVPVETFVEAVGELQQQQRAEPVAEGEMSDARWILFLPAGTTIGTGDAVICDGERFELVGEPWPARNPRTRLKSHVEATLRRTSGADDEETGS
jgi:hypothetical protein